MEKSMKEAFAEVEKRFLDIAKLKNPIDRSGSCALIVIIMGNTGYICNLGDSRALLIHHSRPMQLTEDHKPSCSR
jgi:protein phosphatase 2C family protein 2/3